MELRSLELFVSLKNYPSLNQAAQSLFVSQPALSALIRNMEEELGCILLDRMNDGVKFTPIGEIVYTKALKILEHIEIVKSIPPDLLIDNADTLSFATNFSYGGRLLADVITTLQEDNFDCFSELVFIKEEMPQIVEKLADNKLNFALVKVDSYEEGRLKKMFEISQIEYVELYQEDMCIVVRDTHPLLHKKNVMFSDLRQYCNVIYENNLNLYLAQRLGKEFVLPENIILNDEIALWNYLYNTDGIAVMSERDMKIEKNLLGLDFSTLEWDYFEWKRTIFFLTNEIANDADARRCFSILRNEFEKM